MILTNDEHILKTVTQILTTRNKPDEEMEDWNLDNDKDEE